METIYYNGKIITMEHEDAESEKAAMPEAVYVKDGIIEATGSFDKLKKAAGRRAVLEDLDGKCLMPAFIDAHGHALMTGMTMACAELGDCESDEEIIEVLRKYISDNKIGADGLVIGFGYDHNFLRGGKHPGKAVLDQVSREIPIAVIHVSAHMGCVNSKALELSGITAKTKDPEGGRIGRNPDGSPDGYLEEGAMMLLNGSLVKRMKADKSSLIEKTQRRYIENGITTIQDGATTPPEFENLKKIAMLGKLRIDVVSYPIMPAGADKVLAENEIFVGHYRKGLKIGGYKLVLDGSPQGRSAWMSQPYVTGEEGEGYRAYPWMKDEDVYKYVLQAVKEKRQLLVHCNGDAASQQFLDAYTKAVRETGYTKSLRPVMIHCQTVRNDQLDRMAKMKMIASVFVGHVYYWGDVHMKNLGSERGSHISPVRDAIDRGVRVNFHQDSPVTKPDMLHSIWCAVNRVSRGGNVIGEDQKITVYEALKAATVNGAFQYHEEKSKGSIRTGKRADLIILDKSPLDTDPMEIKDIKVMKTIKDGDVIYDRNEK